MREKSEIADDLYHLYKQLDALAGLCAGNTHVTADDVYCLLQPITCALGELAKKGGDNELLSH